MIELSPIAAAMLRGLILSGVGLFWVIAIVRLVGLRVFSKMTAFDFVVTLAIGSLLAAAAGASEWPGFVQPLIAIAALVLLQFVLARLRKTFAPLEQALENQPLLLMEDGQFLDKAMAASRVARSDVYAKLREANALELAKVRAVVLETTGDISVLHGERVDPVLLEGVRRL